jgi:hypothetical protein
MNVGDKVFVSLKGEDFSSYGTIVSIRKARGRGDCNIKVHTEKLYGTSLSNPTYLVPCMESEVTLCE